MGIKMKNLAILSSFPLMAAGLVGIVTPAEAATIVGTIEISGANIQGFSLGLQPAPIPGPVGDPGNLIPVTTIDFGFIGDSNPSDPDLVPGFGEFAINSADGIFSTFNPLPFQAGRVKDLPSPDAPPPGFEPVDDFLAFASPIGGTEPVTDPDDFTGFFDLTDIQGITYTATANGINVNFDVDGLFTVDGEKYDGEGIIGGEALFSNNVGRFTDLPSFIDYLSDPGAELDIDSWSGNLNATIKGVPEPASVVGLMALGLAGVTLRKRSQKS
jgi:hypothetical protein